MCIEVRDKATFLYKSESLGDLGQTVGKRLGIYYVVEKIIASGTRIKAWTINPSLVTY